MGSDHPEPYWARQGSNKGDGDQANLMARAADTEISQSLVALHFILACGQLCFPAAVHSVHVLVPRSFRVLLILQAETVARE